MGLFKFYDIGNFGLAHFRGSETGFCFAGSKLHWVFATFQPKLVSLKNLCLIFPSYLCCMSFLADHLVYSVSNVRFILCFMNDNCS